MSTARGDAGRGRLQPESAASSMSPRSPRASRNCRSTARRKARLEALGRRLRPRLGDRPPAGRLWTRRQGDARAVQDGQAGVLVLPPQGPAVGDPCRRPCPAAAGAGQRRALRTSSWSSRTMAHRRLDPSRVRRQRSAIAVGRKAPAVSMPAPAAVLRLGARVDRLIRRDKAKLTPDRVAYFCHPDWVVDLAWLAGVRRRSLWIEPAKVSTARGTRQAHRWLWLSAPKAGCSGRTQRGRPGTRCSSSTARR